MGHIKRRYCAIMSLIHKFQENEEFRTLSLTILSGVFLFASFFRLLPGFSIDPAWVAIIISGIPIFFGAIKGLVTEFDVTADVLVAIALVAAVIIGQYFAAGEVAFIMQLGKVLEDYTAGKSHKILQSLIKLTPQYACIRTGDGEKEILASQIKPGNLLLVRPGESVPVDGKIIKGSTSINQAVMTGESVPVDKEAGDVVYQGTINLQGAIEIEATNVGEDSSLKKMIRLVEEAEENKAPIVRIADKWARILVPVALGCAVLIWLLTKDITRAVTALVVFCPCSLILAVPTAIIATMGNVTKKGILIKSGAAVETLSKINTIVMDKTGTLTYGKLQVEDINILDKSMDYPDFISLIASAEKFSEHPLGKAIIEYSRMQNIIAKDPEKFEMQAGKGVVATVDGHSIQIGEKAIDQRIFEEYPQARNLMEKMQERGKTVLPVASAGKLIGIVAIADVLRKEAANSIKELKNAGVSRIVMLTGDNQAVADAIGKEAGVTDIYASQLPEDKVNSIKRLTDKGNLTAMVGDGINDAPALATASVGIVMGAIGSDVAIEASDIALMGDDLSKLPFLIKICRKARGRIFFNIAFSMLLNFGAIFFAGFGMLNPVTGALVHNFGSVFVVVNSALLLIYNEEDHKVS